MTVSNVWFVVGCLTVALAVLGSYLGLKHNWSLAVMASGTLATAVLLSTAIVKVYGWHALWGFLLVLFPTHALAFVLVGLKTRRYRLLLVCATFAALTGVAWIRFRGLDADGLVWFLRFTAILTTGVSLALLARGRTERRTG